MTPTTKRRLLICCLALTWVGVAGFHGYRATQHSRWPFNLDQMRDLGIAQEILDHVYPVDVNYARETIWYNPLVGAVTAGVARLTGLATPEADVVAGRFANLFVPITFFVFGFGLLGPETALVSLVIFLFATNGPWWFSSVADDSSSTASYTPWLFASTFSQALFFITLWLRWRAHKTGRTPWHCASGVSLGATFLGHAAPGVIAGTVMAALSVEELVNLMRNRRSGSVEKLCVQTVATFLIALVVTTPLTYSILFHYHLKILNWEPNNWVWDYLTFEKASFFLKDNCTLSLLLACAGFVVLAVFGKGNRLVVFIWFGVAFSFFIYSYILQLPQAKAMKLPSLMPGYHFLVYLSALKSLLAAYFLAFVCKIVRSNILQGKEKGLRAQFWQEHHLPIVVALVLFLLLYPSYRHWSQLKPSGLAAATCAYRNVQEPVYTWVMEHTAPLDVFLAHHWSELAMYTVMPAGRKVVCTWPAFSNPYVDYKVRGAKNGALWKALLAKDESTFLKLAEEEGVKYVLVDEVAKRAYSFQELKVPFLSQEFSCGPNTIYRVNR